MEDVSPPRTYRTGEFARRAGVSVRTLRFYDRNGLLRPSGRSHTGHRRYADADLVTLQRILALKLLGFTLAEIRALLTVGPQELPAALAQQRAMLKERAAQIARAIRALDEATERLRAGEEADHLLVGMIEAMKMNEEDSKKTGHLTPKQREALEAIAARSYSPEAAARLEARPCSEEDQAKLTEQWKEVYAEAERLALAGADPTSAEGRALGARYGELLRAFTQDDPEVKAGLERFYAEAKTLPAETSPIPPTTWEAMRFAEQAYKASQE